MAASQLVNGIKNISTFSLVDQETSTAHALLIGTEIVFNPNFKEEVTKAASLLGVNVPVQSVVMEEDPQIEVMFPSKTSDVLSLALNAKLEKATGVDIDLQFNRVLTPTKTSYDALGAGFEGDGVAADAAGAIASVKRNDAYTSLTREDFATFVTTGPNTFAVGDDGALKFSTDVLNNPVALRVPYSLPDITYLGETPYLNLSLTMTFIMDDLNLVQLAFDGASVILDGQSINFAEKGLKVAFRSIFTGANCRSYTLKYLGKALKCAA